MKENMIESKLTPYTVLLLEGWNYTMAGQPCRIAEKYTVLRYLKRAALELLNSSGLGDGWRVNDIEVYREKVAACNKLMEIVDKNIAFAGEYMYADVFLADDTDEEKVLFSTYEEAEALADRLYQMEAKQ